MLIYISPFMALGLLLPAILIGITLVMSFKKISILKKEQHFIDQYAETARICSGSDISVYFQHYDLY